MLNLMVYQASLLHNNFPTNAGEKGYDNLQDVKKNTYFLSQKHCNIYEQDLTQDRIEENK